MQATLSPVTAKEMRRKLLPLPSAQPDPSRVAVLLNKNARRVNDRLARELEGVVGAGNLFYSRSLEEAEGFAREIVQRGYGTVVCGGGDGTLARTINLVQHYIDESNNWRTERYRRFGEYQTLVPLPRFGFLRLGTGNGIGAVCNAGNPVKDLARMVATEPPPTRRIPLMEVDGERCFFAGMGYDSLLLNDYNWLKNRSKSGLMKPVMQSVLGYFAALFARTLPNVLLADAARLEAKVVTRGTAYYIDPRRGDAAVELAEGTTLFDGKAALIGAGTVPFYGYGFKIFPFAGLVSGMMNLRIGQLSAGTTLAHLPGLWKGTYRHPNQLFDFFATDVEIELAQPYPFQHSGDAQGMRKSLRLRIADESLDLVDLHPQLKLVS